MICFTLCRAVRISLLGLIVSACASHGPSAGAQAEYAQAAAENPIGKPYVIGVGDVIRLSVWKSEDLSTDALVRPDGTITMPVVGELRAAGRTAAELQREAAARVATILRDSSVTVSVVEVNSYRFTVAGNVERPGLYTSRQYVNVAQAIALAGGPNRYASTDRMVLVRVAGGRGERRIPVNYDDILSGRDPEENIVLLPGDSLQVP
ncbi:MAG TPA: polysaccharide biosynthesis/export family protein [Polyangiaceae bacterium]|nr:polysaccharide biosynthesis/export family protein [Polyangiaceae bacterium]